MDNGHRLASYDTSLVVSGGVDCGRRRRNIYDKKPQRYAKDNRTAHLTARSDKSVAYVTNNKRLHSTFCTVEAKTTDRHEASRGLFATAELLVVPQLYSCSTVSYSCLLFLSCLSAVLFIRLIRLQYKHIFKLFARQHHLARRVNVLAMHVTI